MATRYVYSVYNTTASKRTAQLASVSKSTSYPEITGYLCKTYDVEIAQDRDGEPVALYTPTGVGSNAPYGLFNPNNSLVQTTAKDVVDYKYAVIRSYVRPTSGPNLTGECYLIELGSNYGVYWHSWYTGSEVSVWNNDNNEYKESPDNAEKRTIYITGGKLSQGNTLIRTESSSSKSLEEGVFSQNSSFYWRTYKGSDNIDPTSVTYSKTELYAGDEITISVAPRTPTYGGTVYYQYQYTFNGTTWSNLGSRTTSTTASVTVPEGATQFRARVVASDGWGFTSTSYVYGPALGVSQLKAYGTVGGVTRTLTKGYCIVDGTVRSLAKGYVTSGGVWKKLF